MTSLLAGIALGVIYWIGWMIIVVFGIIGTYNLIRSHIPIAERVKRVGITIIIILFGLVYMHFVGIANTMYCKSLTDRMDKKEPFVTACTIGISGCDTGMVNFLVSVKQRNYGIIYVGWGYVILEEGSLNESRINPAL